MNRKDFLSSIVPLASAATVFANDKKTGEPVVSKKIPPYLKRGDLIGITCPSGHISAEEIQSAINKMNEWGFKVCTDDTVGAMDFTLAGTDEQRADGLQKMLDNPEIKAIMLGRGGYGA